MNILRRMIWIGLSSATLLVLQACGDDGGDAKPDARVIDAPPDMSGCVCDPVGDYPAQSALLNATLATGVEVITREPRHPGCAGPDGLP